MGVDILARAMASGKGGGSSDLAIKVDSATDEISLTKHGEPIPDSGATLPKYGLDYDTATGGLTLTKDGQGVQGETVALPPYGSPLKADTASAMQDTDKVYVYTGSESGYENGHWYYYDSDATPPAWTDGGVYNAVSVVTDKTLTVEDVPADAKATGEAIDELKTQIIDIPAEPIKNLLDPRGLLEAGWTESSGVYSGTPKALINKWDVAYPLNRYNFKPGVRYTISLYANRDASAEGNGLAVSFTYTDGSAKNFLYIPNSTTTPTKFSLTSKSAHDVASIYFSYSSEGDTIWHLKDIMLVEGTTEKDYTPFALTAIDDVARENNNVLNSNLTALSEHISHVVTLPRGTNPLFVPANSTIRIKNNSTLNNASATAYDENGTEIGSISANIRQESSVDYKATQNIGYIRFYSADTTATATVTFFDTVDEKIAQLESYHANPIPSYFQDAIETAKNTVKNNMMGVGKNGDTFVFITDIHWENNRKYSPALIKYLIDHLNINKIICGGDLITQGERDVMSNDMLECIKAFTFPDVMLPTVFGNHDSNWNNYGSQRDDPTRRFDINAVYSLLCKQAEPYVKFMTDYDCSFYFDNDNCNTRYICLDTGEDDQNYRYFTAFDELAGVLNNTPNGYNIVIVAHIVTYGMFTAYVEPMLDAYNEKTTYEYDGTTYDFANAKGHVVIGIGGHTHADSDHTTTGGIPIVVVTCDLFNADSTEGTVTEQAFDVVTLDYTNDIAYFERVGKGVSRTFTLG